MLLKFAYIFRRFIMLSVIAVIALPALGAEGGDDLDFEQFEKNITTYVGQINNNDTIDDSLKSSLLNHLKDPYGQKILIKKLSGKTRSNFPEKFFDVTDERKSAYSNDEDICLSIYNALPYNNQFYSCFWYKPKPTGIDWNPTKYDAVVDSLDTINKALNNKLASSPFIQKEIFLRDELKKISTDDIKNSHEAQKKLEIINELPQEILAPLKNAISKDENKNLKPIFNFNRKSDTEADHKQENVEKKKDKRKKQAEEDKRKKQAEEDKRKKQAEEDKRKKQAEEDKRKKQAEEDKRKKQAEVEKSLFLQCKEKLSKLEQILQNAGIPKPKYLLISFGTITLLGITYWLCKPTKKDIEEEEDDDDYYDDDDEVEEEKPKSAA